MTLPKVLFGLAGWSTMKKMLSGLAALARSKKIVISICIFALLIFIATIVFEDEQKTKINAFLQGNGWEEIQGGSQEEIDSQFAKVLARSKYGTDINGSWGGQKKNQIRVAKFIVENEYYATAKQLFYPTENALRLMLHIALKVDSISDKSPNASEFLTSFYQRIKEKDFEKILGQELSFFTLYEASPELLRNLHCENIADTDYWSINGKRIEFWLRQDEPVVSGILNSSEEFKKRILEALTIQKGFPASISEDTFASYKPSNPSAGKYLLVYDDERQKLPKGQNSFFYSSMSVKEASRYETETLKPAKKINEAQIVIYENYFYERQSRYTGGYVYFRNTNVKAIDITTGREIFNETFKTKGREIYRSSDEYVVDDDYNGQFKEQIFQIIRTE